MSRAANPLYHELISAFDRLTGVPVVLNTSFNESEPIVNTPEQALDCYRRTGYGHAGAGAVPGRMRILHVIPSFAPRYGGPTVAAAGLTRELARRGHDVTVATTNVDGPGELDVPLNQSVPMDGVDVWYFPIQRPRWYHFSASMGRALRDLVRRSDVVHIHYVFLLADHRCGVLVPQIWRAVSGARGRRSRPSLAGQTVRGSTHVDCQQGQEGALSQDYRQM